LEIRKLMEIGTQKSLQINCGYMLRREGSNLRPPTGGYEPVIFLILKIKKAPK
jgi:hypothetical protein